MQFLFKFPILISILLLSKFNSNIPIFVTKSFFLSFKTVRCKEHENNVNSLNLSYKSLNLSQESSDDTPEEESETPKTEYTHSNQDDDSDNVSKQKNVLEYVEDSEIEREKDFYNSLCFSQHTQLGEPLQLVYPNDDHTELILDTEVLKVLERVPKPIYPVSFIGSVGVGKSFLLNLVNDNHVCSNGLGLQSDPEKVGNDTESSNQDYYGDKNVNVDNRPLKYGSSVRVKGEQRNYQEGFRVSRSPEPETFGIWVYSEPLRISRKLLQDRLKEESNSVNFYSLKNVSSNRDNQHSKLSVFTLDEYQSRDDEDELDDIVNVVLIDVEGFNSHKNVFKYDEAVFSIVSSISSEVVYVSNKTLNTGDLHMLEELIKSSLLSKISNLYTLYGDVGKFRDDREEVFQYFLKMFENKNLTFLVKDFSFTYEQAFENLVNLLKAPKRDLSLHEFFLRNNKNLITNPFEYEDDLVRKIKYGSGDSWKYNKDKRVDKASKEVNEDELENGNKEEEGDLNVLMNTNGTQGSNNYVCTSSSLKFEDVMFSSFGYIFHMLFNSVNISVLPDTSLYSMFNWSTDHFGTLSNLLKMSTFSEELGRDSGCSGIKYPYTGHKAKSKIEQRKQMCKTIEMEYLHHLSTFKRDLFGRSTRNSLVKYCNADGVTSTCHMSGRDLSEMIKFTLNTLSLNKFYRLATNIGSVEGLGKVNYKDAFDEYFRVFRSTRLLMIKNDLYESYKNMLNKYISGTASTTKEWEYSDNTRFDTFDNKNKDSGENTPIKHRPLPTMSMYAKYSQNVKEQFVHLLVKNFENEAVSDDFVNINNDLESSLSKLSDHFEEELSNKIRCHCTDVSEMLFSSIKNRVEMLRLPVVPSRLNFLHHLPNEFKNKFEFYVNPSQVTSNYFTEGVFENGSSFDKLNDTNQQNEEQDDDSDEDEDQNENQFEKTKRSVDASSETLLSEDLVCKDVMNTYIDKLKEANEDLFKHNENLIDLHFRKVFNKAMNHFKSKFLDVDENYKSPLSESLEKSVSIIKECNNIMLINLGEFHGLEYLVNEYKTNLRSKLEELKEKFKSDYTERCYTMLDKMHSHYSENYTHFLRSYTKLPTNPETLYKFFEYVKFVANREFLRVSCVNYVDVEQRYTKLEKSLKKISKELEDKNVELISKVLEPEFLKLDQYLMDYVQSSKFYLYFRYNAKRYAKYRITQTLIYSKLKLDKVSNHPVNSVSVSDLLYDPSQMNTVSKSLAAGTFGPMSVASPGNDFDLNPLNIRLISKEKGEIQKKLVNQVIDYYMDHHVTLFKTYFVSRVLKSISVVFGLIIMGLSMLSMTLTSSLALKVVFGSLSLGGYTLMSGLEATRKRLVYLVSSVVNFVTKSVLTVANCFKTLLYKLGHKLLDMILTYITNMFMKFGLLYTFVVGFMSAATMYFYLRYLMYKRRLRKKNLNLLK